MTCDFQSSGGIELYFYGELTDAARTDVQAHLRACAECRRALEDLGVIRAALASRPDVATPPGGDWSGFMTRLDAALGRVPDTASVGEPFRGSRRVLVMPFARAAPWLAAAALLVLVCVAVLMLARQRVTELPDPSIAESAPARQTGAAVPPVTDPALASLTEQHFERSKLVVLGLTTRDATDRLEDDWAYERELAASLLSDTRLYRLAAEERGMKSAADVMRDLELVLLQASMSEHPDRESLERLQRLIRSRDLLTKMNMVHTGS